MGHPAQAQTHQRVSGATAVSLPLCGVSAGFCGDDAFVAEACPSIGRPIIETVSWVRHSQMSSRPKERIRCLGAPMLVVDSTSAQSPHGWDHRKAKRTASSPTATEAVPRMIHRVEPDVVGCDSAPRPSWARTAATSASRRSLSSCTPGLSPPPSRRLITCSRRSSSRAASLDRNLASSRSGLSWLISRPYYPSLPRRSDCGLARAAVLVQPRCRRRGLASLMAGEGDRSMGSTKVSNEMLSRTLASVHPITLPLQAYGSQPVEQPSLRHNVHVAPTSICKRR